jgi:modulator of FtsH protease
MQRFNESTVFNNRQSLLSSHSVLRNTYLLLSLTLLFSAGCAWFGVISGAGFGTSMLSIIAAFVLLFVTSALRNSAWGILAVFAFTGCMGYSMGPLLNHFIRGYTNGGFLILTALAGTGFTFFGCSAYVLVTKKDMSGIGKTLMIGLIVCIVASIANIFLKMPAMQLAISAILTFISAMLMMYDTSRIIHNGETNYIMATISLFIDIQMMFQNLLMLLGVFNNRD